MRKISMPKEVRKRLLRAGFARSYANRTAQELQEHWKEIVEEALTAGASREEAKAEAAARLGSPESLANELIERMQQSSWLGRNPTFGFGMIAIMLTLLWWILLGSLAANFCGLFASDPKTATDVPIKLEALDFFFGWIRSASYITLPWLCCHISERYCCGWRPALWACLVLA